ncbi:MAG: hypothetical protein OFPI_09780 [Osedax symbiont Rs2]|nr:MAG: hypothetical protein OFPI_09780 [Osedax symbiont Rs2]
MNTLKETDHIKLLTIILSAALLALHSYAFSETTIRLISKDKLIHSDFARRVGIDQTTLLWPIQRCPKLFSKETQGILRSSIELVIICNAFRRAGFTGQIQMIPSGNAQRQKIELAKANADLIAHSTFKQSLSHSIPPTASRFLLTDPVIKQGQFLLGIFTSANQLAAVSKAFRENTYSTLIAATLTSWKIDIKTLQEMKLKSLHLLPRYNLIAPNIEHKRANFTLAALDSNSPQKRRLKRVEGYKVALADERVFLVNKHQPLLFKALQDYIAHLRTQDDALTRAYRHANFISDKYQNWTLIN